MKITVHRATNLIGGGVTEYDSNGWKLFVDSGELQPGVLMSDQMLEIDGLTCGDRRKSALLITHCHGDHIGKITELPPELTIFMGNPAKDVKHFTFGEFDVTPIIVEHSAFDAYGFCIEAKELRVFHSGVIRKHGFLSGKLPAVIESYVDKVDYVVCEATNVSSPDNAFKSEHKLPLTGRQSYLKSLDELFSALDPKAIIPVHTDNPRAFADLFCDKWPVILLNDKESFSAIKDPWFDIIEAKIFAYKQPEKSDKVIDNPEGLEYWALDERSLGEFQCWKDAEFALHHLVYAPNRLLAYSIETNDDMAPSLYVVYTPDFIEYSEYSEGGHEPGGNNYQEKCAFSPGDRVLAIIGNELLMPCTLIGPTSEEFFKEKYRKCGAAEDKIDEFVSQLWDWEWDTVVVKPLVKIDIGSGEMPSEITAQRIYLFPYKESAL
ncbi:MAG: hypothetical protein K2J82_07010 [Muribaculaceae bacterium]|nr:hypothetical protein [Muribaculaceae bacterium]